MRTLIAWLFLLATPVWAVGPIGTIGSVPTVNLGNVQLPNVIVDSSRKILNSRLSCGNATRRSTFRTAAGVAYQVGGATAFNTLAIGLNQGSIGAEASVNLFYSDNDVGIDGSTAATNPIYYSSFTSTFVNSFVMNSSTAGNSLSSFFQQPVQFQAPSSKYLGVECQTIGSGDVMIVVTGIEN